MLFKIIRYVLLFVLIALSVIAIIKSNIKQKPRTAVFAAAACLLVVCLLSIFPPENLFVRFHEPETVFHYINGNEIQSILPGNDSCMIIHKENEQSGGYDVIPKSQRGYLIPTLFSKERLLRRLDENGYLEVCHVKGRSDYYLFATVYTDGENSEISILDDSGTRETELTCFTEQITGFLDVYLYFDKAPMGYTLMVGEKQIPISKQT